jgi:PKD repeat protein
MAIVTSPPRGVAGQPRIFTVSADEVGPTDREEGLTFTIDWGDGDNDVILPTPNNADGILIAHVFTAPGVYTVSVTATDQDNESTTDVRQITIVESEMQGTTLAIGGTGAVDKIKVSPNGKTAGAIKLKVNGVKSTFAGVVQIEVFGQGGNDKLTLAGSVTLPAFISGGDGDDKIKSGKGPSVLLGGAGDDKLTSSIGRDLLIGGLGADVLKASSGEDILIGGTTDFDSKLLKLAEVMSEWNDTLEDVATRIGHLDGSLPGGLNNGTFLNAATLHDDADMDTLIGSGDTDWFFAMLSGLAADDLKDDKAGETVTGL